MGRTYYQQLFQEDSRIQSVLMVTSPNEYSPLIDGFDYMLLVIVEQVDMEYHITHYIKDQNRIQERWISRSHFERLLLSEQNRTVIQWILQGEILLDQQTYLGNIRERYVAFSDDLREQKRLVEFSLFLKCYQRAKEYLQNGQILDAHSSVMDTLLHWARIVIIEEGVHPELTLWSQLKKINPGVYKLYEELTQSNETLEQRVKLILLASDFSIMSKMRDCCSLLLRIIESRPDPWKIGELMQHPSLLELPIDLSPILKKLAMKHLVREVAVTDEMEMDRIELQYAAFMK